MRTESVLSQLRDPHLYPELSALRIEMAGWRFYHQFRTDAHSPLRQPQIGVRTPILSHDRRDLAAALQTIDEIGDRATMREAIASAFHGADLLINSAPIPRVLQVFAMVLHNQKEDRKLFPTNAKVGKPLRPDEPLGEDAVRARGSRVRW